jgi:mRNA-degrading endonuclease toxin of MazEF toxin-antitoxin module
VVRRGQVWTWVNAGVAHRVVIISNDEFNAEPGLAVWALLILPEVSRPSDLTVHLCDADAPPGYVSAPGLVQILDRGTLKESHGFLAPGTMRAVEDALKDFLELT